MNRNLDETGRLVIPKEMRDELGLKNGDTVRISVVDNKIVVSNPDKDSFKDWLNNQIEVHSEDESVITILKNVLNKYNELN